MPSGSNCKPWVWPNFQRCKCTIAASRWEGMSQAAHWIYELLFNNVSQVLLRYSDKSGKRYTTTLDRMPLGSRIRARRSDPAVLGHELPGLSSAARVLSVFRKNFSSSILTQLDQLPREQLYDRVADCDLARRISAQAERATFLESAVDTRLFSWMRSGGEFVRPLRRAHPCVAYKNRVSDHPGRARAHGDGSVLRQPGDFGAPYSEEPKEYRPSTPSATARRPRRGKPSGTLPAAPRNATATPALMCICPWWTTIRPNLPAAESITTYVTCTNRNLTDRLSPNGRWGELELDSSAIVRTSIVRGPTKAVRPPLRKGLQWRLISHVSLNHLSLVEGGADALREILRLYDTAANPSVARQISGLTSVRSSRKMARLESEHGFVFCQGIAIDTEFDEEQFAGSGAFLLASILERFFGLYSASTRLPSCASAHCSGKEWFGHGLPGLGNRSSSRRILVRPRVRIRFFPGSAIAHAPARRARPRGVQ